MMRVLVDRWAWLSLVVALAVLAVGQLNGGWFSDPRRVYWLYFPVLLLHQFEEFGFPGGLREWWNRTVFKSDDDNFPLTRELEFWIELPFYWSLAVLAAIASDRFAWAGLAMWVVALQNGFFHLSYSVGEWRYSPGVVTGVLLFIPGSLYAGYALLNAGLVTGFDLGVAVALGVGGHTGQFIRARLWQQRSAK